MIVWNILTTHGVRGTQLQTGGLDEKVILYEPLVVSLSPMQGLDEWEQAPPDIALRMMINQTDQHCAHIPSL